jgi:hypothetical protein
MASAGSTRSMALLSASDVSTCHQYRRPPRQAPERTPYASAVSPLSNVVKMTLVNGAGSAPATTRHHRPEPASRSSRCRLALVDCQRNRDVRFTSTNRHREAGASGPKSAMNRLMHRSSDIVIRSPRRRWRGALRESEPRAILQPGD